MKQKRVLWGVGVAFCAVALFAFNAVQAQEPAPAAKSVVVPQQPSQPAQADQAPAAEVQEQAAPAVEVATDACCAPKYCITYRKHHRLRKVCCDPCLQPYTTVLQITDPCTCCPVEVPVCVPGCCTDAPSVSCHRGLFGRTITEFTWCCGYRVKVVLTRGNNIVVHTYGS